MAALRADGGGEEDGGSRGHRVCRAAAVSAWMMVMTVAVETEADPRRR